MLGGGGHTHKKNQMKQPEVCMLSICIALALVFFIKNKPDYKYYKYAYGSLAFFCRVRT